eukprot:403352897
MKKFATAVLTVLAFTSIAVMAGKNQKRAFKEIERQIVEIPVGDSLLVETLEENDGLLKKTFITQSCSLKNVLVDGESPAITSSTPLQDKETVFKIDGDNEGSCTVTVLKTYSNRRFTKTQFTVKVVEQSIEVPVEETQDQTTTDTQQADQSQTVPAAEQDSN